MKTTINKKRGFALAILLLFICLLMSFIQIYFVLASSGLGQANKTTNLLRAYYVADAGLADAFMQLRAAANPPPAFNVNNNNYPVTPGDPAGSYSVGVVTDGSPWPTYTISSTGTWGGATKTLRLMVRMLSFSRWAYFSNTEIDPYWGRLYWITGMLAVGPTHCNDQFNMYGTPVFDGPVSQVASAIYYYNGGPPRDNPDFQHGLTLNAPRLPLPTDALLNNIKTAAQQAQGLFLTGASAIKLLPNSTMNVTNQNKNWNGTNVPVPANKAVFVENGAATVEGTLKGQLTIGCNTDIFISGNILYNTDPRKYPTSTDMLGLVARNNVTVTDSGPFNIEIDACIVALTGSFQLQNFQYFLKGDMVTFGGLLNNLSGPTGMFDPRIGKMIAGYNQIQVYDDRFNNLVPPSFTPVRDANGRINYFKISLTES